MLFNNVRNNYFFAFFFLSITLLASCSYDLRDMSPKPVAGFTVTPVTGQVNKYLLTSTSQNAFIYEWNKADGKGFVRTKSVDTVYYADKGTYQVKLLVYGHSGIDSSSQTITVAADDPASVTPFKLLTRHGWKLDPSPTANAIVVGTESNPSQYYAGGALAACQLDDVYTFTEANTLTYNANGATFNAGNIAPNYACGGDKSFNGAAFTFSNAVANGMAGLATIQLSGAVPDRFIGVTDVPAENTYRIISIDQTKMVLRAGNGSGNVFQMKFVAP